MTICGGAIGVAIQDSLHVSHEKYNRLSVFIYKNNVLLFCMDKPGF